VDNEVLEVLRGGRCRRGDFGEVVGDLQIRHALSVQTLLQISTWRRPLTEYRN